MAYIDYFNDAKLYFTYDNTYNYVLNGSNPSASITDNGGTGTPVFVADAPAGLGFTHSLKTNNYATLPKRWIFKGLSATTDYTQTGGRTVTAWVKFASNGALVSGTTNLGSTLSIYTESINQSGGDGYFRIGGGTYNSAPMTTSSYDRAMQIQSSETIVSTSVFSNFISSTSGNLIKLSIDEWHHVAFTTRHIPSLSLIERAMYIDGVCVSFSYATGKALNNFQWGYYSGTTGNLTTTLFQGTVNESSVNKLICGVGFWNRPLTIDEIRAQAWYNHQNEDYQTAVLSKNPTYYARFDNATKSIDHTVLGTSTNWGPLSDDKNAIYVNEPGIANGKAWRFGSSATAADNYTSNTDADMIAGVPSLIRSGEFSIEFWTKFTDLPTTTKQIIGTNSTNQNGTFNMRMNSGGYPQINLSYKSGTSTYVSGSIGSAVDLINSPTSTTTGAENFILHPGGTNLKNWCDNQWHHVVYTQSNTDAYRGVAGEYNGCLYIDGLRVAYRTWTNTYGWLDGTGPATDIALGNNSSITTLRDSSVAELAFYPRRLSDAEILNNFRAGKDYISDQGAVKYYNGTSWVTAAAKTWNGTAWVDWVKKYWNGTAWIDLP